VCECLCGFGCTEYDAIGNVTAASVSVFGRAEHDARHHSRDDCHSAILRLAPIIRSVSFAPSEYVAAHRWPSTLTILTTDNGGTGAGVNYPLRGRKVFVRFFVTCSS
jgi:hypothetical protein